MPIYGESKASGCCGTGVSPIPVMEEPCMRGKASNTRDVLKEAVSRAANIQFSLLGRSMQDMVCAKEVKSNVIDEDSLISYLNDIESLAHEILRTLSKIEVSL